MARPRTVRQPVDSPWRVHDTSVDSPCPLWEGSLDSGGGVRGVPVGCSWVSMGSPLGIHGQFVGSQCVVHGYPWTLPSGAYSMGSAWGFRRQSEDIP